MYIEGMALQKVMNKVEICMMFSQLYSYTCSTAQWFHTQSLRYNLKGCVATLRAMPTPFYLSMHNLCIWALRFECMHGFK